MKRRFKQGELPVRLHRPTSHSHLPSTHPPPRAGAAMAKSAADMLSSATEAQLDQSVEEYLKAECAGVTKKLKSSSVLELFLWNI